MAVTVKVLSAGAVRRGVTQVAKIFEHTSGVSVAMDFSSAPKVRARVLAGEQADVLITSARALDALARESKIVAASRMLVGRSRMVVVMRKGARAPDLSNTAAFRQVLLAAGTVLYNKGSSGIYAEKIIDELGLRDRMGARFRAVQNGGEMMEFIASHDDTLGLAQISNLLDHMGEGVAVALAGFFPDELQNPTVYEIAVGASSRDPGLAETFVREFASAEAKKLLVASGLD